MAAPAITRAAPSAVASRAAALRARDPKLAWLAGAKPYAKPIVDVADVPPLHRPDNRENNLGNGYRQRLGGDVRDRSAVNGAPVDRRNEHVVVAPGGARDRAVAAAERARAERERASGIREMRAEMHRERAQPGAHPPSGVEKRSASDYAAAPSRVKLPLISGNGAVVGRRDGVSGYAPAAPLPGGRAAGSAAGAKPFGVYAPGAKAEEENAGAKNENGKNGVGAAMPGNEKRRVGLSNLSNLGDGGKRGAPRPARRPAPMARNFYF